LKEKEQPVAARQVALQAATEADCTPTTQPIWHEGCWQPLELPVQQLPLATQRASQEADMTLALAAEARSAGARRLSAAARGAASAAASAAAKANAVRGAMSW